MTILQGEASDTSRREMPTWAADKENVFLLTCYMLGGPEGRNLGAPGYSHDFVARLFRPLLERWGEVVEVRDAPRDLQTHVDDCIRRGKQPVHFSVLPFQDVCLAKDAPNIVMPAWEYPDVPNEPFDSNPQNDWAATANRCDLCLVSGPFTANALISGGATTPIRVVPVPTPEGYRDLPAWHATQQRTLACRAYVFQRSDDDDIARGCGPAAPRDVAFGKALEGFVRGAAKTVMGDAAYDTLSGLTKSLKLSLQRRQSRKAFDLPYPKVESLELTGVVYTTIFNPDDGRKNWNDLLTGYLCALADRDDATLVVKLIARKPQSVKKVIDYYLERGIKHRCKLAFICDFLTDEQMLELCQGTTFYLQSTKAEGNCLPLMNYLAAGRPGISPDHSSMSDYFSDRSGFVVESHPEPATWPHERRPRLRTTWGRIVWTSLRDQIQASYRMATDDPSAYAALSTSCRDHMHAWADSIAVAQRLDAALDGLLHDRQQVFTPAADHAAAALVAA